MGLEDQGGGGEDGQVQYGRSLETVGRGVKARIEDRDVGIEMVEEPVTEKNRNRLIDLTSLRLWRARVTYCRYKSSILASFRI
jgi:hypothetical protein